MSALSSSTFLAPWFQWANWWPWLTIAALGLFHGINPAMGWLFAVALGLHQRRRAVVLLSLVPIALGHAVAVAVAVTLALSLGSVLDHALFARVAGVILLAWAAWHALRGHRMRPRVGMRAGMAGLAFWSFLMAAMHGAGLMLVPSLMALCASPGVPISSTSSVSSVPSAAGPIDAVGAMTPAFLAIGLHTAAMLVAISVISLVVYDRVGVAFLRTGWVNLDWIWAAALAVCGAVLVAS